MRKEFVQLIIIASLNIKMDTYGHKVKTVKLQQFTLHAKKHTGNQQEY